MEENDVKGTCGGTRSKVNIEKDEKFIIQNLTRCNFFKSKPDKTTIFFSKSDALDVLQLEIWLVVFFQFKIWHVMKFSI